MKPVSLGNGPVLLKRRGSWLISQDGRWQMASVEGPLEARASDDRQYFQVFTANQELLLVSRPKGERGMRELQLDSILESGKKSA